MGLPINSSNRRTLGFDILTTGMVARAFACAPKTIVKWADLGKLPFWTMPSSKDRRFRREDVIATMLKAGYTIPSWLTGEEVRVSVGIPVREWQQLGAGWRLLTPFALGVTAAKQSITTAVIGDEWGTNHSIELTRGLLSLHPSCSITLIVSEDCPAVPEWNGRLYKRPVDWIAALKELMPPLSTRKELTA